MNAEITVIRKGAHGFCHEFVVDVALNQRGVFSAHPQSDVPEKHFSRRFDPEGEWLNTGNTEFFKRHEIVLSAAEKEEALAAIFRASQSVHQVFQEFREQMAA